MNEDITRILQMLEEGKINAAEAERLIRALKEPGPPFAGPERRPAHRPGPFRDLGDLLHLLSEAARRAARRQRRMALWRLFQFLRCQEEARKERARTMGTYERVRFLLRNVAVVEADDIRPESRLRSDLKMGPIAMDNLRFGLEVEFHREVAASDLDELDTVQAVVDYVDRRLAPEAPEAAPGAESPGEEPAASTPETAETSPSDTGPAPDAGPAAGA